MKTSIVAFLAIAGSASAFAPMNAVSSSRSSKLAATNINPDLEGMYGTSVETGGKIFDPLGLSQWLPMDYARKAELSNGRSAMLGTVGWLWPKFVGTFDSQDVTTTDPIDAIMQADPQWWAQFIIFCGTIEAIKYRGALQGKSFAGPGEPVVDYLKMYPSDEKGREEMHMKELKNGRLAMLGMAAFISEHFIPGSVPGMPEGWA